MSSFYNIRAICKKNVNFNFYKKLNTNSAQGSCGLFVLDAIDFDDDNSIDCRNLVSESKTSIVFYKFGRNNNCTLARHEYIVARNILMDCNHFPNFLRPIVYIKNHIVRSDKTLNPFDVYSVTKSKLLCVDVVVFEHLDYHMSLHKMFMKNYNHKLLNSIIMQLCLAIISAQKRANFVHNDLHCENIVILKCDPSLKIFYKIEICGKQYKFLVNTYGYFPVIIDYGCSYSKDCIEKSLENADFDNYGLITYSYDSLSDFIRFFCSISKYSYNALLISKIKEMFTGLPINVRKGFENVTEEHTSRFVYSIFNKVINHDPDCSITDVTQYVRLTLRNIVLPIKHNNVTGNLHSELKLFFDEWKILDSWLKHDYEKIYMFRQFLDSVRKYKTDYKIIRVLFHQDIKNITGKNLPIILNWQLLVDKMILCVDLIENVMYEKTNNLRIKREKLLYTKLISGEHMFLKVLDTLIDDTHLELNDTIMLIDDINKLNAIMHINKLDNLENLFKCNKDAQ